MRIGKVGAPGQPVPIADARQHTPDFGRIRALDPTLVRVETEGGPVGYGEAKAAVGRVAARVGLMALGEPCAQCCAHLGPICDADGTDVCGGARALRLPPRLLDLRLIFGL